MLIDEIDEIDILQRFFGHYLSCVAIVLQRSSPVSFVARGRHTYLTSHIFR
jgi:hypothetical protein